jgi:hypothetical protein
MLPVLEQAAPEQIGAIRDAVSQLQIAYVKIGGQPGAPGGESATGAEAPAAPESQPPPSPAPEPPKPGEPGPAQRSGRLWVPGQ